MADNSSKKWKAFPWLSVDLTSAIIKRSKALSNNTYEQSLIQNDLYKKAIDEKAHTDYMNDRNQWKMELYQKSITSKSPVDAKNSNRQNRTGALADMLREYWRSLWKNWDSMWDQELIQRFVAKNPWQKTDFDDFINGDESDLSFANRMWFNVGKGGETTSQKVADVAVWTAQSPGKRWYNIVWQRMDRLGKRWAEQLEGSALEKWVQDKAVELFWEDEVKAYQQEMAKDQQEWTTFKGREATDIRTPLLWEERANNKYTKAWEVVWDIASWIALTAPAWVALAPVMANSTALWAWIVWAWEWALDTAITHLWSQWNLDISPLEAAIWVWAWALGWVITNKLANLPKKTADDLAKQAQKHLKKDVKPYVEKSIKPTVKGKLTQTEYDKFMDDVIDSVSDMVNNKQYLQYTDDAGNLVKWELPTNLRETSEAISNYKKVIYDQYNSIAQQAWDAGARVNLNKVYQQLDDLSNDVAQNMANPWTQNVVEQFKKALLDYSDEAGTIAIEDAQKLTQNYNKQLSAFFKNPNMNDVSKNAIVANMNKWLKDAINESLDDVLENSINNWSTASQQYTQLKRLYGSLTNIEDEVSKRALVEARKNIKGLSDTLLDSFAGWEITDALLTLNPTRAAKAWVMKFISNRYNYLNSPNTNIRKLFENIEKGSNPSMWSNMWSKAWEALAESAALPSTAPTLSTLWTAKNTAVEAGETF